MANLKKVKKAPHFHMLVGQKVAWLREKCPVFGSADLFNIEGC